MLPRRHRLRAREAFSTTIKRGNRCSTPLVTIHFLPLEHQPHLRAGLVVGKAVGKAATRNRVKRRLRAALSEHLRQAEPGNLVVRAHPGAADATFGSLLEDVRRCMERLGRRSR